MSSRVKGKKIYSLEICFNDETHEVEYIDEFIDGDRKSVYYGDIDISDYFDEDSLKLINSFYEVGVS